MTPGGYEKFFEELAQLPPGPPDMARFEVIFEKYDQETVEGPRRMRGEGATTRVIASN
jgi:hypothetical protein